MCSQVALSQSENSVALASKRLARNHHRPKIDAICRYGPLCHGSQWNHEHDRTGPIPSYDDVIARIAADPEEFWLDQAKKHVDWITEPTRAVDDANAPSTVGSRR